MATGQVGMYDVTTLRHWGNIQSGDVLGLLKGIHAVCEYKQQRWQPSIELTTGCLPGIQRLSVDRKHTASCFFVNIALIHLGIVHQLSLTTYPGQVPTCLRRRVLEDEGFYLPFLSPPTIRRSEVSHDFVLYSKL